MHASMIFVIIFLLKFQEFSLHVFLIKYHKLLIKVIFTMKKLDLIQNKLHHKKNRILYHRHNVILVNNKLVFLHLKKLNQKTIK